MAVQGGGNMRGSEVNAGRRRDRPTGEGQAYDVFISYSHGADSGLAPVLQTAIQSLAKPWYRRRALVVFRDQTTLGAPPDLWPPTERALTRARFFVLLASPTAAASPW